MISTIKNTAVAGGLMLLSTAAVAHPGHDHAAWESPLMHTLFYGAMAAAGVAAAVIAARAIKARKDADK